jgi:hypothetical protein
MGGVAAGLAVAAVIQHQRALVVRRGRGIVPQQLHAPLVDPFVVPGRLRQKPLQALHGPHLGPAYRQVVRIAAWQRRATGLAVEADRPGYVLEALGPVPASTRGRRAWRQAAAQIGTTGAATRSPTPTGRSAWSRTIRLSGRPGSGPAPPSDGFMASSAPPTAPATSSPTSQPPNSTPRTRDQAAPPDRRDLERAAG